MNDDDFLRRIFGEELLGELRGHQDSRQSRADHADTAPRKLEEFLGTIQFIDNGLNGEKYHLMGGTASNYWIKKFGLSSEIESSDMDTCAQEAIHILMETRFNKVFEGYLPSTGVLLTTYRNGSRVDRRPSDMLIDVLNKIYPIDNIMNVPQGIVHREDMGEVFAGSTVKANIIDPLSCFLSKAPIRHRGVQIEKDKRYLSCLAALIPEYLKYSEKCQKRGRIIRDPKVLSRRFINETEKYPYAPGIPVELFESVRTACYDFSGNWGHTWFCDNPYRGLK